MSDPTAASPFSSPSPSRSPKSRLKLFNTIRRLLLRNYSKAASSTSPTTTTTTYNNNNKPTKISPPAPPIHHHHHHHPVVKIQPDESLFDIIKRHELEAKQERKSIPDDDDDDDVVDQSSTSDSDHQQVEARQKRAVKEIVFGKGWDEKERAAIEIERLAREHGVETRKSLAMLGVIPPLVAMAAAETDDPRRKEVAIAALLQLVNGSVTNAALMVEAGILSTIPTTPTTTTPTTTTTHNLTLLLQSISSLPNTSQLPLNPTPILPFLTSLLTSPSTPLSTKHSSLTSLHNLSTILENSPLLVTTPNLIHTLLLTLSSSTTTTATKSLSDKSLATLGNLVVTSSGKKAIEQHPLIPETLIDVVSWEDKPKCQEQALYILMILAHHHQSFNVRDKMEAAGIVPVLLEVGLLGSTLAQKRALRLLQWFKDERGNDRLRQCLSPQIGPSSAISRDFIGSPVCERENSEGKRLIKRMVKQSLYRNMEVITKRANLPSPCSSPSSSSSARQSGGCGRSGSRLKALIVSSSSKSLPY